MQIIENVFNISQKIQPTAIALGYFDGIHLGHQKLIESAMQIARQKKIKSLVFTFKTHPLSVLAPNHIPKLLFSNEKKIETFESIGIDYLIFPKFTHQIMKMSPENFVQEILVEKLNTQHVIVGFNYTFGYRGTGTPDILMKLGRKYGFEVTIIEPVQVDHVTISSSLIRKLLLDGDIKKVNKYLGRNYSISGKVIQGKGLGKKISIPTANIEIDNSLALPRSGVYHTKILYRGKIYVSLTNIGINPTFKNHPFTIETHILNFSKDIYNEEIEILFVDRIRPEIKFDSLEDMVAQIKKDIEDVNKLMG